MSTQRLFLAISLPGPVRDSLAALEQPMPEVTWTRAPQRHVTLRFLGDVPAEQLDPLTARLATIRVEPFLLPIEGVGAFPPKRPPRILWAGVGSGHPRLYQLRQRLDDALLALGFEGDLRTFHPHVTLARCSERAAGAVANWLHVHRDFAGPLFNVDAFELYASELRPDGAVHTLLQRISLT